MKIYYKQRLLPDGRAVNYHSISEVEQDLSTNTTVVFLKSYTLESSALALQVPDATFSISIPNSVIQNTPNYLNELETYLNTLPDWEGIVLYLDQSIPVIPPTLENPQQTDLLINIGVPIWLINTK